MNPDQLMFLECSQLLRLQLEIKAYLAEISRVPGFVSDQKYGLIKQMEQLKNLELLSPEMHGVPSKTAAIHPELHLTDFEGVCKQLNQQIDEEFYPSSIKLPFVPKAVFYLPTSREFMIISSHGKVSYIQEDSSNSENAAIIDIGNLVENELRFFAMVDRDRVYVGDIYYKITLLKVSDATASLVGSSGILKRFEYFSSNDCLYIFEHQVYTYRDGQITRVPISLPGDPTWCSVEANQTHIAVSDDKGTILVVSLNKNNEVWRVELEKEANPIKLTSKYLIAAVGDELKVWSTLGWTLLSTKKGYTSKFTCLDVNASETILAAGCKDGSVQAWSLQNLRLLPQKFVSSSESIESIAFISDSSIYYFSSENNRLMLLTLRSFPHELEVPQDHVLDIVFIHSSNSVALSVENNGILVLDATTLELKKKLSRDPKPLITYNRDADILFALYCNFSDRHIYCTAYSGKNFGIIHRESFIEPDEKWWANKLISRNGHSQVLQLYANGLLSIFKANVEIYRDCKLHEYEPTEAICLNSGDCSISGDVSGTLIMYNLEEFSVVGKFRKHEAPISALAVSAEDQLLLSGSSDGVIHLSDVSSRILISVIHHKSRINKMAFSTDLNNFFVNNERGEFSIWNLHSRTIIATKSDSFLFETTPDDTFLYIFGTSNLKMLENPLNTRRLCVFGNIHNPAPLFKYLKQILQGKHPAYEKAFTNCLIAPYQYNLVHFYAYFNLANHLRAALKEGCFIVEGFLKQSPLTLCIVRRSLLMNDVIEYILSQNEGNIGMAYFFRHSMSKINRLGSEHLAELYEQLFVELELPNLPEFCDTRVKLPLVIESSHTFNINPTEFFDQEKAGIGQAIEFKQFPIKMCFEKGSKESIEFLKSLIATPSIDVYRTKFIEAILRYKWKSVKWVMTAQGFLYLVYIMFLVGHIASSLNLILLIPLTVITVMLTIYEVLQVLGMGLHYFLEIYNIIDTARTVSFFMYLSLSLSNPSEDFKIGILITLTSVSLLRGITYFSLFDSTRYMIYLITQVVRDALAFVILLAYSIIAVSALFTAINYSDDDTSFVSYLEISYNMSLGNYDSEQFSVGERVIILFASILNMIIMLNLLISILGDTFDRVQQGLIEADREAIAELIVEAETLMFWRRKRSKLSYLTVCSQATAVRGKSKQWEGKVRTMLKYIESIKKVALTLQTEQKVLVQTITKSNEALKQSTMERLDRLEQALLKQAPDLL